MGRHLFVQATGMYYSLIDNLAFLLNSLPPYNGAITSSGSLFAITPIIPGAPVAPSCGPGVPTPCTTYAPQGVQQDAKTPAVQEWNLSVEQQLSSNMSLRVAYVGSFGIHGLLSVDPNSIFPQICATATCTAGGTATTAASQSIVTQGQQYIPLGVRPNPYLGAGFFWFTEGNSRYNALQIDVTRRLSRGLQFRTNYTWSKNMDMNSGLTGAQAQNQGADDHGPDQCAQGLGSVGAERRQSGYVLCQLSSALRARQERGRRETDGRMAAERYHNAVERIPVNTADRIQPLGRRGHCQQSGPVPTSMPNFTGTVLPPDADPMVQPQRIQRARWLGTWGSLGRGFIRVPGWGSVDLSVFKTTEAD